MFSRFTDQARGIVSQALKADEGFRHDHIGPEHLLLGLASGNAGAASMALTGLGVSHEMIRRAMERLVMVGTRGGDLGPPPFTPQAKHALERASEEAHDLGHPYIGSEHIMLGFLSAGASVATTFCGMGFYISTTDQPPGPVGWDAPIGAALSFQGTCW